MSAFLQKTLKQSPVSVFVRRGTFCRGIVRSGNCPGGELSGWGIVRSWNCPRGELSVGELSVGELSVGNLSVQFKKNCGFGFTYGWSSCEIKKNMVLRNLRTNPRPRLNSSISQLVQLFKRKCEISSPL